MNPLLIDLFDPSVVSRDAGARYPGAVHPVAGGMFVPVLTVVVDVVPPCAEAAGRYERVSSTRATSVARDSWNLLSSFT